MALLYLQNRDKRVIKSGDYVKYAGASTSSIVYALLGEANIIGNATERIYPGKWGNINPLNNYSGVISYNDLTDKPTIPTLVNADWNASSGDAQILNKPDILNFSGLAKITVGTTEPSNPSIGDIWIDSSET